MKLLKLEGKEIAFDLKAIGLLVAVILLSNVATYLVLMKTNGFAGGNTHEQKQAELREQLYLLDQASKYVYNVDQFEDKVKQVSHKLDVPPEWLMAVMHSESRFDASVKNHKGSGATGLIQFMPTTAKDYDITVEKLRNMNHVEQMDFVFEYLNEKRETYRDYDSLTDLYLAILYPKAIAEEYCYTLYAKPTKAYEMNIGLDKDKDGRVTVQDIDKHLRTIYPTAYMITKNEKTPGFKGFGKSVSSVLHGY